MAPWMLDAACRPASIRPDLGHSNIIDSTVAAASREMPGVTWEYMSSVMAIVEWPSRSETIFGWTPALRERGVGVAEIVQPDARYVGLGDELVE